MEDVSHEPRPPAGPDAPDPEAPLTTEEENLLARSARAIAAEDPEGFIDLSARVRSTVRATTRRSRPVHATFPSAAGGATTARGTETGADTDTGAGTLVVREWVLVGELRRAVAAIDGVTPTRITVTLDGDTCTGALVHVTATFGAILAEAATRVRRVTLETLETTLGADALELGELPVDVVVDDVVPG